MQYLILKVWVQNQYSMKKERNMSHGDFFSFLLFPTVRHMHSNKAKIVEEIKLEPDEEKQLGTKWNK